MQNKLTQVSNNDTNNSQNTLLSPLEEAMNDVNNQIYDILPEENQIFLKEKEALRKKLLFELEEEVKKISDSIDRDYRYYKDYKRYYTQKLCADDWEIEKAFQKLLKENTNLAKIYYELLDIYRTESLKKIIQKKLFIDYFEDLVYDSMEYPNCAISIYTPNFWNVMDISYQKVIKIIKELPQLLKSLYLWWNYLWENLNWKEWVELMRSLPPWLKLLNLSYNRLWEKLSWQELVELMRALPQWLKGFYLWWNSLWKKLNWQELVEIIKALPPWLKILYLDDNFSEKQKEIKKSALSCSDIFFVNTTKWSVSSFGT